MKRNITAIIAACTVCLALAAGLLAGCSTATTANVNTEQQANRAYMSQVNELMSQVSDELDDFVKAVSDGDTVGMRMQAENTFKSLDKLTAIEAPDDLKDIQQGYADGTDKLRQALNQYIDLYTAIDNGTFDWTSFASRLGDIQSLYDEGINSLKQTDEAAAEL